MERGYYIPRGCTNYNVRFFLFKKFDRQFRFPKNPAVAVGQVCSGLAKPAGALLRAWLSTLVLYVFATYASFVFCFFLCVFTSFFRLVFTKLVMHFFWLVSFCILSHVFICAVYNYLFICLLTSFIFVIVCVIALLPHFLHCFQAVLCYFFCQTVHICYLMFAQDSCRVISSFLTTASHV